MLHETRIHFQHRIVKTQFSFCHGAAPFNNCVQATPGCASLFIVAQVPGAPDAERSAASRP